MNVIDMRQGLVIAAGLMFIQFAGCDRGSATPTPGVDPMASEVRGHQLKPADEIRLEYRIVVPDHVKGTITLRDKDDTERVADYRKVYRSWHRDGWEVQWDYFLHAHERSQSVFTADLEIPYPQGNGYQLDAYNAGHAECAAAIKSLTDRYGEEAVREALKRQLEEEKAKGNWG
jgi:hypothetical protein